MDIFSTIKSDVDICISQLKTDQSEYIKYTPSDLGIKGDDSNLIFLKNEFDKKIFNIVFGASVKNSILYIGRNMRGSGSRICIDGSFSIAYFGDDCRISKLNATVAEDHNAIIVGDKVTVASTSMWTTGCHSGERKAIVVGDDCMFSYGISIRGTDGHPIFDSVSMEAINDPQQSIVIEPHCWVGQGASILKGVRIGACSIVSMNALVTKSFPRFSMISGTPATYRDISGKIWGRNKSILAKEEATLYLKKYSI